MSAPRRVTVSGSRTMAEIQPAHRTPQRTAQDKMDLPDRRRRVPHAGMRPATLVALVSPRSPVIHTVPLAVEMVTAVPQLGLDRVEHVGVKSGHLDRPDKRQNMPVHIPLVRTPRVRLGDRLATVASSSWPTVASARGSGARTPGMAERADGASDSPGRPCGRQGCPRAWP